MRCAHAPASWFLKTSNRVHPSRRFGEALGPNALALLHAEGVQLSFVAFALLILRRKSIMEEEAKI